jgi:phosphoenolpyruvate-protein phosphotransferase/dihydroxyacetone kinase phosphotransfer subunit
VIGIVVVSHSPRLAQAAVDLALEMVPGEKPAIAIAAGAGEGVIGTDATKVADAIRQVASPDGVLVVMDLGSAVLSAEMALEFVADPSIRVRLTSAPFVEGLLAGIVRAASGATLDEVELEARGALGAKAGQLEEPASVPEPVEGGASNGSATASSATATVDLTLANPSGLHIRPAAMLVAAVTGLDAVVTIENLRTSSAQAAANSPTALLMLAARKGDTVRVTASGADAEAAIAAIAALVADGFGELDDAAAVVAEPAVAPSSPSSVSEPQPRTARGGPLGVSPGRAVGPVVRMSEALVEPPVAVALAESDRAGAADRIDAALASVAAGLRERADRVSGEAREILEATATMAADPSLLSTARQSVQGRGDSPERAIWTAIADIAALFSAQGGRIGERVTDLYDVRNRALAELLGRRAPGIPERGEPFVLVARDLAPADTALLDPATCRAIVTVEGGPTSHTAILAKALGIPALVAVAGALDIPEGTIVLVDGTAGTLTIDPAAELIAAVEAQAGTTVEFDGSGHTADGHPVQLLANVGSPESVESAVAAHAEGIGLFRTEFLFLERADAPTVAEQTAAYRKVFAAFPGRKVIIRTLDAGADKPLAFVTATGEDNPALGVRGYRTSWRRPDLIDDQLGAIAAAVAAERAEVQVMAPMIDTPDEAADFASRCAAAGLASVGVMIETPAAAITAPEIFAHVDFVSLGTNDLAQYTMAADRLLGDLALLNDPWQPAVLRMIRLACDAGTAAGKPVGVCGEAAADPLLAAVLVGLGTSSLSMSPRALGHVGELLAGVTLAQCRAAATDAVAARTATGARDAAAAALGLTR